VALLIELVAGLHAVVGKRLYQQPPQLPQPADYSRDDLLRAQIVHYLVAGWASGRWPPSAYRIAVILDELDV